MEPLITVLRVDQSPGDSLDLMVIRCYRGGSLKAIYSLDLHHMTLELAVNVGSAAVLEQLEAGAYENWRDYLAVPSTTYEHCVSAMNAFIGDDLGEAMRILVQKFDRVDVQK